MAITITSTEPTLVINPAYLPIEYDFTSDNVNIEYCIVEVFINDIREAAVSVQPNEGTTDEFTVDISGIVQDFLSNTLNTIGSNGFNFSNNGKNDVRLRFYEAYDNAGVLTTAYDPDNSNNLSYDAISNYIVVANWTEGHFDLASYTYTDYEFNDTRSGTKFQSLSPLVKEIELGQDEFLGIGSYAATGLKSYSIEILTYDSTDALLNTDTIALTEWNSGYAQLNDVIDDIYMNVAIGTQNLINQGISLTNVAYYTVKMINVSGDRSETRRYNIVEACDKDVRVHWFNKFGQQESMTFKGNKVETVSNKSTSFEKALSSTYSSSARGTTTIQNVRSNGFTAYSKTLGRDTYQFALTALDNNQAYIEVDNQYHAIIIDDISVVKSDEENIPVQFALNYRLANRYKGLRG
jgi:hypothetical protein